MSETLQPLDLVQLPAFDADAAAAAQDRWNNRAKPPGSLGRLEAVAVRLAGIAGACPPPVPARPAIGLFAGDHGVVADGASAWPSEITAAMVQTIAGGGAAISAFGAGIGASVTVVDVGVNGDLGDGGGVLHRKVRAGTASIAHGPAMTPEEALAAVDVGRQCAADLVAEGADCLIGGEMGIGNTTPSAALISVMTQVSPEKLIGPGAGEPAAGLAHKQQLVEAAVARTAGSPGTPAAALAVLAEVGGLEIAALAGFAIGAAVHRVPFVVDGVIACAALCIGEGLKPGLASTAIAGHRSSEPAATAALNHLDLDPLLDLDLRLGEGTGAALAFPLVSASARALADMADLPVA